MDHAPEVEVPDQMEGYIRALGWFVSGYSAVETVIRLLFTKAIGIEEAKLEILFEGRTPPIAQLTRFLRKLNRLEPIPRDDLDQINGALDQFGHITDLRDRLVHSGGYPIDDGRILVRPKWKERHLAGTDPSTFLSLQDIKNATIDLQTINHKFVFHFFVGKRDEFQESLRVNASAPWRYKPKAKTPTTRREPRHGNPP